MIACGQSNVAFDTLVTSTVDHTGSTMLYPQIKEGFLNLFNLNFSDDHTVFFEEY